MKKLLLVMTLGLSFALAGCGKVEKNVSIKYDKNRNEIIENYKKLKDDKGFYIKYKTEASDIEEPDYYEYGSNKDLYMNSYYSIYYTDLSDPTKSVSYGKNEDGGWHKDVVVYAEAEGFSKEGLEKQEITFNLGFFITPFPAYDGEVYSKTTTKVCGRKADKYIYNNTYTNGDNNKEKETQILYYDQEYGICLGYIVEVKTYDDKGKVIDEYYNRIKCVSFKTNYDVVLPEI